MTEKLYEQNAYCKSFSATVESCREEAGSYYVVLNQTAFFPEGGGQKADEGLINGQKVLDVQEKGGVIEHKLAEELPVGTQVSCEIDWELRYSRMQSHTGEHILSGVVHALFGYDNVGFHMSDSIMQVDFNGPITPEDIEKVELLANSMVYKNADIVAYYPTLDELMTLEYRSKIAPREGIRIVKIGEDIDCCACCAPHLAKTGEVGLIKIVDAYSYKQGTRVEMLAGIEALKDYMEINASYKRMMKMMSTPRQGVEEAVKEQNESVQSLKFELQKVSKELAFYKLETVSVGAGVYAFSEGLSHDELRYCANRLQEDGTVTCLLFSKTEGDRYNYVVSSQTEDVKGVVKELNDTFSGRGGGQKNYAQGMLMAPEAEELKGFVTKYLENLIG